MDYCRDTLEVALMKLPDLSVRSVASAEEALESLAGGEICAMIVDLHLPRMDGFELIEAIRAQPRDSPLPIVVVSGDSDPETPARLAGLGANAYFPKPYSPSQVRRKLEELIDDS